ncbi:MAG: hydantoinase/oxoprolinase family protein, partial [Flavobacteriales bacterium]|nr:hydantoinase/oxoprolinase family protein [Flavobacteriales bacterium]
PRQFRFTVDERIDAEGNVLKPLDTKELDAIIERIKSPSPTLPEEKGASEVHPFGEDLGGAVEAIAICFMNSYLNGEHEKQATEYLRQQLPEFFICGSYEVLPSVRFYERVSTTCVNAYIGVVVERYLKSLLGKLETLNFNGKLLIMQSNGGVVTPEVACKIAAVTSLSGPAAAPIAGAYYADLLGYENCITMDMGGTSFDASLVVNGQCVTSTEGAINRYRIALPTLDIITIGAGGGSVGWIDSGGLLKMGPKSAGSLPGPISYDRGGEEPACTDADLILGYLDPDFFAGGKYKLNKEKAVNLTGKNLGKPLGMDAQKAAAGMYRVINMNMAQGVREVSVERGFDPREFLMICAGGAGSIHAGEICRELEIPMFVVPSVAPIFCAAGMLLGDLKHDYVRSYLTTLSNINREHFLQLYDEMKSEAISTLIAEGMTEEKIQYVPSLDLRYVGQFHEVPLEVTMDDILNVNLEAIKEAFHKEHNRQFGYELREEGTELEVINIRLRAIGITEKPQSLTSDVKQAANKLEDAIKGKRPAYIPETDEMREVVVYDGDMLTGRFAIEGPCIIEQVNTTMVLGETYNCETGVGGAFVVYNKDLMPDGFQEKGIKHAIV